MTGSDIPASLPDEVRNEIQHAVAAVRGQPQQQQSVVPLAQQQTGIPSYSNPQLNIPTQPTGIYTNPQAPMMTGVSPMMSTGGPQVTMPTGMLGNTMNFANRMMPHSANYNAPAGFESLSKNVKIPWAVTSEEKKQYSKIFKAWDTEKKGTLSGDKAKEIFSQSGLPQNILMQIWNLSDPNNQGKLNVDEFSVAMHLIYRKLNGYNVPETLPAELIPPSTRDLHESVSQLKKTILEDIAKKRHLANFSSSPSETLSPPISQYRSRSVSPSRAVAKKDTENDAEVGYVSSARRMGPDRTRNRDLSSSSSASSLTVTSSYGYRGKATRIFDLRKEIEEKKKYIKKLEEDSVQRVAKPYNELSALEKRDIDDLKDRVKELQIEISKTGSEQGYDAWNTYIEKTAELSSLAEQEKALETEIIYMLDDTVKGLLNQVDETENDLLQNKLQSLEKKAASAGSSAGTDVPLNIIGTGPNGEVTESDRIRAKAKAMVAARMGKITGKSSPGSINLKAEKEKIEEEREEFKMYTDSIADSLKEIEEAVKTIHLEISMIGLDIRKQDQDQKKIEERGRFEHGQNVAKDVKEFISQLAYDAALAKAPEVDPSFESRFPSF
ncbi:uncharacterized protein EV154DRAFT_539691 [Mucor mucedo]|uniref:uncharacterized protein n=1 Tax=Mucor mucedo TaxID=29922 RepID=UPI00221F41AF|nr:uncharacterized protein EV154DRAFT_539691 [Mucor mucedo]KAI7887260.1 hypothetical protein EV154DRAFT_539691 [Mucor mucedo]